MYIITFYFYLFILFNFITTVVFIFLNLIFRDCSFNFIYVSLLNISLNVILFV